MERRTTEILIVEDNDGDARLIVEYLRESPTLDAQFTRVITLADALNALEVDRFDVILLDLSLSDSSGLGSVRVLMRTASTTPVVVLSGNQDSELILQAVQAGAQDYLPKQDASTSILSRTISSAIERQAMLVERDTLATIGRVISSSLDIDSIFEVVAAEVQSLIPLERMVVLWRNADQTQLSTRHIWGSVEFRWDVKGQYRIPISSRERFCTSKNGVIGWIAPFFTSAEGTKAQQQSRELGLLTAMFAPLRTGDETMGLLNVATVAEDAYSNKDLRLLETIANQISGAVQAVDLYDKAVRWTEEREQRILLEAEKRELERINEVKSRIITTVTHELKTPLTSMTAFVDILSKNRLGNLVEQQLDQLEILRRNSSHLHLLINDLLDHSRIESGTFQLLEMDFDAGSMLKALGISFEPLANQAGQTISVDAPSSVMTVSGDQNRISQAISNLLSNATKYAGEGAHIQLNGRVEGELFIVEVNDNGAGMAASDAKNAFDLYYRAENPATRAVSGLGLGLNITQTIIGMHDGRISIDSELNRGTSIRFEIPRVVAESDQAA